MFSWQPIVWHALASRCWFVALILACSTHAQIATDGTVGLPAQTLTGPAYAIPDTLGSTVGTNLFHSFQTFNIPTGGSATFTGPNSIANVFSRVTGGSISNIDGALNCTIPQANFFFINPAGVLFGPNASINVGGSFAVTSADYIKFADGGRFDVRTPANDVLTVATPVAFGFLGPGNGTITLNRATLGVTTGKELSLIGGNVSLKNQARVLAPGGRVNLVATNSAGEVQPTATDVLLNGFDTLRTVGVQSGSLVSTSGTDGGRVFARSGDFLVAYNSSTVAAQAQGGQPGLIDIRCVASDVQPTVATGWVALVSAYLKASGNPGGRIAIVAKNVDISGSGVFSDASGALGTQGVSIDATGYVAVSGGGISSDTSGLGHGGSVRINAEQLSVDGNGANAYVSASTRNTVAGGDAGNVQVTAHQTQVLNGGWIGSHTYGPGDGGSVIITADSVTVDGKGNTARISTTSNSGAAGNVGNVQITAIAIQLLNGGQVSSTTSGFGTGGSVIVDAESVIVDGTGRMAFMVATSNSGVAGNVGNVQVTAAEIQVLNGGIIASYNNGLGEGGAVILDAESVIVDGNGKDTQIASSGIASDAGNVKVTATEVRVLNGGGILSNTYGLGDAGSVIVAAESLTVDGEGNSSTTIAARSSAGAAGNAGNVEITATEIQVLNGGQISSDTWGLGDAGSVILDAESLTVDGEGNSSTSILASSHTGAAGNAGDVEITATDVQVLNGGTIRSATWGLGDAGSVIIDAESLTVDGMGKTALVDASSGLGAAGKAGNVQIMATDVQVLNGGGMSSTTGGAGTGGSVIIAAKSLTVDGEGNKTFIATNSNNGAAGNAGDVHVTATDIQILNGGFISSSATGIGDGGSVIIDAESVTIDGEGNGAQIAASSTSGAAGNAGDVQVTATDVRVLDRGSITSSTSGLGTGGSVTIAAKSVLVDGKGANAAIVADSNSTTAGGNAGDVHVTGTDVQVLNGGKISSSTFGLGKGGSVTINADSVTVDGNGTDTWISASSNTAAAGGNAGNIQVTAHQIGVLNGGRIASTTSGLGEGGSVTINAESITVDGKGNSARISADSKNTAAGGNAGDVRVTARQIQVLDGGDIASDTYGLGDSGSVTIDAEAVTVDGKGNKAWIDASSNNAVAGGKAGDVRVKAATVKVLNAGQISSGTSGLGNGGSVIIDADSVTVDGGTGSNAWIDTSSINAAAGGKAGDVLIKAAEIQVLNGGLIISSTKGLGDGGSVIIAAASVIVDGKGNIATIEANSENKGAGGDAGSVQVTATEIHVLNNGVIASATLGLGAGGSVIIDAESVTVDGGGNSAWIDANSNNADTGGKAGDVRVTATEIQVLNGGKITSGTWGLGDGGSVIIAAESVTVDGKSNSAWIAANAQGGGAAGNVQVTATEIQVLNGGKITSGTWGLGDGGSVLIAAESVTVDGEGNNAWISANSESKGAGGTAGNVQVTSHQIQVLNGGSISSATFGLGAGGSVRIETGELVLDRAGISTQAEGDGDAGSIVIGVGRPVNRVSLSGGSSISSSANTGNAGDITINSATRIDLNYSAITVKSQAGNAGTVTLNAPDSILLTNSLVSAEAGLDGGNIEIDPDIFGLVNSFLNANAESGNGGHIGITADFLYLLGGSRITAISANQSAQQGTVTVRSGVDFAGSLAYLSSDLLAAGGQVREGCERKNPRANSLIVRGSGGMALRPDMFLPAFDLRLAQRADGWVPVNPSDKSE